ncbi:MAG: hypothetical protein FWG21_01210 [Oscillospiraceae bacterium]|nr:hypothetical protein [Oscillospiraceae bacterium]
MNLTSIGFILFVAIVLTIYYVVGKHLQWMVLLLSSVGFIGLSGPFSVIAVSFVSAATYGLTMAIDRINAQDSLSQTQLSTVTDRSVLSARRHTRKNLLLTAIVGINLLIFIAVRLRDPLLLGLHLNNETDSMLYRLTSTLPLGLSFYVFQAIGYAIDVKNKKYPAERNFLKFTLYLVFFPCLTVGPINRFEPLTAALYQPHCFDGLQLQKGLLRLLYGLFKKTIVADRLLIALRVMDSNQELQTGWLFWIYALIYIIVLYCDFSGGIDIIVGVTSMFGIKLEENFLYPFYSKNIAEFWRRWHITLGGWFRDYVYYPLVLSSFMLRFAKRMKKISKILLSSQLHIYLSTLVIWLLIGLWHGISSNYIAWGIINGVLVIFSMYTDSRLKQYGWFRSITKTKLYNYCSIALTFILVTITMLLDRFGSFREYLSALHGGFTGQSIDVLDALSSLGLSLSEYILVAFCLILIIIIGILVRRETLDRWFKKCSPLLRFLIIDVSVMVIVVFGVYGIGFDAAQFIYGQF